MVFTVKNLTNKCSLSQALGKLCVMQEISKRYILLDHIKCNC